MPTEGAAQLDEESKGNQVEDAGLVQKGDAGKKPRAKKSVAADENGPHVLTTSTASAEGVEGAEPPVKKARAKKAAAPTEGAEEAAPKKTARKKKDGGEEGAA
jgi:hypothetical protein